MAKKAYPACFNTNSKGLRQQLLTKAVKRAAPSSSFNIREVRQAQVIDLGYNETDLLFDQDTIIEYVDQEIDPSNELCHQNDQKLQLLQEDMEEDGSDSPPPASSDKFSHNCTT